jgi:hypothetical protein
MDTSVLLFTLTVAVAPACCSVWPAAQTTNPSLVSALKEADTARRQGPGRRCAASRRR